MPTDDFTPDLSSLANDYQILTALRQAPSSSTYLARHLKLNRDVTITAFRAPSGDANTLTHFATDARALAVMRHRNVVPIIEGRWLGDGVFAIVRARVRGSTLEHVVDSTGALPAAQAADTLEQVYSAVTWARNNGIVHRHVSADSIVFQQGSGRVLLELDPSELGAGAMPDACDDARTMGRLAYEMLSGHRENDADAKPLAELRPDLLPKVVTETEALMQCDPAHGPRDAVALIAALSGKPESAIAPPPRRQAVRTVAVPDGPLDSAVVVVKRPFGYNARVFSAVVVIAIIGTLSFLVINRRGQAVERTAVGSTNDSSSAGGEVSLGPRRSDTVAYQSPLMPAPSMTTPQPIATPELPPPRPMPEPVTVPVDSPRRHLAPPPTRRPEPPRGIAPSVPPNPITPRTADSTTKPVVTIDTMIAKPVVSADGCESTDPADQQRCFTASTERSDRDLAGTYDRLIAALRRQANVQPNDPDPASVDALRMAQRQWTESREAACRDVGAAPLYAKARAECFAARSAKRMTELQEMIAGIP